MKYDDKPVRDTYDTEEEYLEALAEWEEAQKGPFPDRDVPEQDLHTGPDFDEELKAWAERYKERKAAGEPFPERDVPEQDLHTGPGVPHSNYVDSGPGVHLNDKDEPFPDREVPEQDLHTGPGVK